MPTGYNTSRVFEAVRKAKRRLEDQSWPTNRETGSPPHICIQDVDPGAHAEIVQVGPGVIGEDGTIEWGKLPAPRDERFALNFLIGVATGQNDEDALIDRTEQLANVVQRAFYDDVNGAVAPLDIAEATKLEGIGQVMFQPPYRHEQSAFLICDAVVTYRLHFRI